MNEVQRKIQMLKENGAAISSRQNVHIPPHRSVFSLFWAAESIKL